MAAKRVLISIDEHLLHRIDEACARRGMTRSGYLAKLAATDLDPEDAAVPRPRSRSALSSVDSVLGERQGS